MGESFAERCFYEQRLLVLVIAFVVSFYGWAVSCDHPLQRVALQLNTVAQEAAH